MFGLDGLVSAVAALLCALSQIYGGNAGLAIITISVVVRLALLPLSLRMARHAQLQQAILYRLKDKIAALRIRHKSDPQRLATEMADLYRANGVKLVDRRNLAGGMVQVAVGAGLYSAIRRGVCGAGRFLWVRDLGQPDAILVMLTGAITFLGSVIGPHLSEQNRFLTSLLPAILTVVAAWRLSSAVVLYWAASAAVNGVQNWVLSRSTVSQ